MKDSHDIIFKIAFTFLKKKVTIDLLQKFEERDVTPETFFTIPTKDLISRLGIRNDHEFDRMAREEALANSRAEWEKIKKHGISPLFILDDDYPSKLAEVSDAPLILYKLGDADLDSQQIVSVVGTRKPTPYGVDFCNKFVDELGVYFPEAVVVSGLAHGIDAVAHKRAINKNLPTVAVVAHGLNMIYPAANRSLAKTILKEGGAIVSEYPFGVQPFRPNFLARNRIVAAMSDVTVVVESNIKGGAMSTANYAFQYDRELMAVPGRVSDDLSSGCNLLIRKNKAHLITCIADLIEVTGWQPLDIKIDARQRNLFPELEGNEKLLYEMLQYSSEPVQMDQLMHKTNLSVSALMALLSEMEFDGIIIRHPGNRFSPA